MLKCKRDLSSSAVVLKPGSTVQRKLFLDPVANVQILLVYREAEDWACLVAVLYDPDMLSRGFVHTLWIPKSSFCCIDENIDIMREKTISSRPSAL